MTGMWYLRHGCTMDVVRTLSRSAASYTADLCNSRAQPNCSGLLGLALSTFQMNGKIFRKYRVFLKASLYPSTRPVEISSIMKGEVSASFQYLYRLTTAKDTSVAWSNSHIRAWAGAKPLLWWSPGGTAFSSRAFQGLLIALCCRA